MRTTTLSDEDIAQLGYKEAISAIKRGATWQCLLYRRKALAAFEPAFVEGQLDPVWFSAFARDFGRRHRIEIASDEEQARYSSDQTVPFALIQYTAPDSRTLHFVIRAEMPFIEAITRTRGI